MTKIKKSEMKEFFKKHNLKLGFPVGSPDGNIVTDWNYLYHYVKYEDSDLKKFEDLIDGPYRGKYKLWSPVVMASIGVEIANEEN